MENVIGIDLGTTFTVVAHFNQETSRPEIIPDADSQDRLTPSAVLLDDTSPLVGRLAVQNAVMDADRVVEYVKRNMGKPLGKAPGGWSFTCDGRTYNAQEISALILKKVKQDAELHLGQPVTQAVITVPAYFGEAQRAATAEAGRIAGLEVLSILDEPVAAALAYSMARLDENQRIFVFDLGGGTLDVTIMDIRDRVIREVAINGDHQLGGKDFDDAIISWASAEFSQRYGANPQEDTDSYQDLKLRAIQAKEELSRRSSVRLSVTHRGNRLPLELTRDHFDELTRHLLQRCQALCEFVMTEAGMVWNEVDRVLLVGGSTRVPSIQNMLRQITGKEPARDLQADECVALGAAWQAMLIKAQGDAVQWEGTVNPIVQSLRSVAIKKVTSHELGLQVFYPMYDSLRSKLVVPKLTPLPCEHTKTVHTRYDNQTTVSLPVTQGGFYSDGESCEVEMCERIGELILYGIPGGPAGQPVEVTYAFSDSGILKVTACHIESGATVAAEFNHPGGMTDEEIARARTFINDLEINQ